MKIILSLIFSITFLFAFSCTPINNDRGEAQSSVIFINKNFKEYEWKEYNEDSVRFAKPIRVIKDIYTAEYHLNGQELKIFKVKTYKDNITKEVQFTVPLNNVQKLRFINSTGRLNPDSVKQISTNAYAADGFDIDVVVQQSRKTTKLSWSNKYIPELVALLSIANQLAPEKYKFYTNEAGFIQELKDLSNLEL